MYRSKLGQAAYCYGRKQCAESQCQYKQVLKQKFLTYSISKALKIIDVKWIVLAIPLD